MALLQRAEDVAAEIQTRLAAVSVANGYETDLGATVYMGRVGRQIDKTMVPCCTVVEGDDEVDRARVSTQYQLQQTYILLAFVPCDPDEPNTAAHKALRDMKRAIFLTNGRPDTRWGGTVKDVAYLGRDMAPRDDGEAFVLAIMEIAVTYVEDISSP